MREAAGPRVGIVVVVVASLLVACHPAPPSSRPAAASSSGDVRRNARPTPSATPTDPAEQATEAAVTPGAAARCSTVERAVGGHRRWLREVVTFAGNTLTLAGRRTADGVDVVRNATLSMRLGRRPAGAERVHYPSDAELGEASPLDVDLEGFADGGNAGSLCVARFGRSVTAAVVALSTGNDCCSAVDVFPIVNERLGAAITKQLANHGPSIRTVGSRALIESSIFNGCNYDPCAGNAPPIQLFTFTGQALRDVTRKHPVLLRADAHAWYEQAVHPPDYVRGIWLSALVAWVADECRLGREEHAWNTVDDLNAQHRLRGDGLGSPAGNGFVRRARHDLREQGLCKRRQRPALSEVR